MTIGERLREWRSQNNIGQKQASSIFDVTYSVYQKYESDSSVPGGDAIKAFVKAGINANWLLTGEGEMMLTDAQKPSELPATSHEADDAPPEAAPAEASSHAEAYARLDIALLTEVFECLEDALAERQLKLPHNRKAVLSQLVYQYAIETHTDVPTTIDRFMLLIQ